MIVAMSAMFAAVLLWCPARPRASRLTVAPPGNVTADAGRRGAVAAAAVAVVLVAGALGGLRIAMLAVMAAVVVGTVITLVSRQRGRRHQRERAEQVAEGCAVLAGEVRAGRSPVAALATVAEDHPCFVPVASTVAVGGSAAEGLRRQGRLPGQAGLVEVARAWEVSQRTGSALAPVLDVVAASLRSARSVARTTDTELAAARATGQLLGVLPVIGIVLGFILGGNPIEFLLGSRFGPVFLATGTVLTCAGLLWSDHLGAGR